MPVATPDQYAQMLDNAKKRGFAYPAFNVSSSQTLNAVLQGLTEAGFRRHHSGDHRWR
jgi:fructose-bisphosphate aldolase, class II